ncbi:hypothetical protein ACA910_012882 [Epithemia clementina (nom. ined.)]
MVVDEKGLSKPSLFSYRYDKWLTVFFLIVTLFEPVIAHPRTAAREVCTRKAECQLCTAGDMEAIPECKKTGKIETFKCSTTESGVEVDTRHKIESCEKTRADEEYFMVQFQLICLVVGSFSYMTVKRQRQLYATGFDQRKEFTSTASSHFSRDGGATNSNYSRASSLNIDRVSTADERVPLSPNDDESGIEVV